MTKNEKFIRENTREDILISFKSIAPIIQKKIYSMPIFFNFHILLATFYIIFGTNILIQCLVPIHVCCMFYVSQKPHIKQSPNGIKMDEELFWNICDFWEVKSTRDGARGGHEGGAHAHSRQARPCPSWPPRKAVGALLSPQES